MNKHFNRYPLTFGPSHLITRRGEEIDILFVDQVLFYKKVSWPFLDQESDYRIYYFYIQFKLSFSKHLKLKVHTFESQGLKWCVKWFYIHNVEGVNYIYKYGLVGEGWRNMIFFLYEQPDFLTFPNDIKWTFPISSYHTHLLIYKLPVHMMYERSVNNSFWK